VAENDIQQQQEMKKIENYGQKQDDEKTIANDDISIEGYLLNNRYMTVNDIYIGK
jgi:hypothetical protein